VTYEHVRASVPVYQSDYGRCFVVLEFHVQGPFSREALPPSLKETEIKGIRKHGNSCQLKNIKINNKLRRQKKE